MDTSFGGGDGIAAHPDAGHDIEAVATAVQSDGKVVVVGAKIDPEEGDDFVVSRYNADGTEDTSFGGGDGRVITDFGRGSDRPAAVLVQPDGKIVVIGTSNRPGTYRGSFGIGEFAVARYDPNGSPDMSFDGDGQQLTRITTRGASATSVARQPDGRLVVAGMAVSSVDARQGDMAVVRYSADGSHDTTFEGDGRALIDFGNSFDRAVGVGVRTDGKIVLGGLSYLSSGSISLARLNSNGALDTSFGTGGRRTHARAGVSFEAERMLLLPDNKVLLSYRTSSETSGGAEVARFTSGGSFDTSFGGRGDGRRVIPLNGISALPGLTRQRDGRILFGVSRFTNPGIGERSDSVARLTWSGRIDRSFGGGDGVADAAWTGPADMADVAAQPSGRIVIAGTGLAAGRRDFALTALTSSGRPDASFRFRRPTSDPTGLFGAFFDVAVLQGGKILAVGTTRPSNQFGSTGNVYLARFNPDGTFDTSFSGDGKVVLDLGGDDSARRLAVQPDGKFVVFGSALMRFDTDGRLDAGFGGGDGIVPVVGDGMGLQPDNKILVVTSAAGTGGRVSRYNADGTLDTTFGNGGHFSDFTAGPTFESFTASDVAVQPGGRIIVGGHGRLNDPDAGFGIEWGVIALTPSGQLDMAWGGGDAAAWRDSDAFDLTERIEIAPDGRIAIAGDEDDEDPTRLIVSADGLSMSDTRLPWGEGWAYDTAWTPAGHVVTVGEQTAYYDDWVGDDITVSSTQFPFGGLDYVSTDVFGGSDDTAFGVAIEPDGDVVVVGAADGTPVVLRYQGQNNASGFDFYENGDLVVRGTEGADAMHFAVSGGTLTVRLNATTRTFPVSAVRRISADAGGGNDTIVVGDNVPGHTFAPQGHVVGTYHFNGEDGDDRLTGGTGNHTFFGGDGADYLDGGAGADVVMGGPGTDTADYSSRTAPLRITTGDFADKDGEAGENDSVAEDVEIVRGGSADDYIAERGFQTQSGSLFGGGVRNAFYGNGGNDTLDGGLGVDAHFGGAGNDTFVVENPAYSNSLSGDYYNGGSGTDTIDYLGATARTEYAGIDVNLDGVANDGRREFGAPDGGPENDNIEPDVEVVIGTAGADRITGSAANNRLVGNGGDDVLTGGGGRDSLLGGDGNDTLLARDSITDVILDGGAGTDRAQRDATDPTQSIEETLP